MYTILQRNHNYAMFPKNSKEYKELIRRGYKVTRSGSYGTCRNYSRELEFLLLTPKHITNVEDIEEPDIRQDDYTDS